MAPQGSLRMAVHHWREGGVTPFLDPPFPDLSDHSGKKRNLQLGQSCRAIFGTQSHSPTPLYFGGGANGRGAQAVALSPVCPKCQASIVFPDLTALLTMDASWLECCSLSLACCSSMFKVVLKMEPLGANAQAALIFFFWT